MVAAKEDKNPLGNDGSRIQPPFLTTEEPNAGKDSAWLVFKYSVVEHIPRFCELFVSPTGPPPELHPRSASSLVQSARPATPTPSLGRNKSQSQGGRSRWYEAERCIFLEWVRQGWAQRSFFTPERCYCSEGTESTKTKARTADVMGGEEPALMPYSVPSQNLWTFVLPINKGLPGITCLFLKFYVIGVRVWTVVDLQE